MKRKLVLILAMVSLLCGMAMADDCIPIPPPSDNITDFTIKEYGDKMPSITAPVYQIPPYVILEAIDWKILDYPQQPYGGRVSAKIVLWVIIRLDDVLNAISSGYKSQCLGIYTTKKEAQENLTGEYDEVYKYELELESGGKGKLTKVNISKHESFEIKEIGK